MSGTNCKIYARGDVSLSFGKSCFLYLFIYFCENGLNFSFNCITKLRLWLNEITSTSQTTNTSL